MGKGRFKCGFETIFLIASGCFGVLLLIHGVLILVDLIDLQSDIDKINKYASKTGIKGVKAPDVPAEWWIFALVAMLTGIVQAVVSIIAFVKTWKWKTVVIVHIVVCALCVGIIILYIMTHSSRGSDDKSTLTLVLSLFDIILIVVCIILKIAVFN